MSVCLRCLRMSDIAARERCCCVFLCVRGKGTGGKGCVFFVGHCKNFE